MSYLSFTGAVGNGKGLATKLGFPTINIPLPDTAVSGIYAARVRVGEALYEAAVYADQARKVLEAHLVGFSGNLYGQTVTMELYEKIRDDVRFAGETELKNAIAEDVQKTKAFFNSSNVEGT